MTSHFDEFQDTNASKAHRLNSGDFDMHKMTKRIQKSHSYFYAHLKSLIERFSILNRAKKEPYNTFKKPKFWNLTIMKSVQFFPLILWDQNYAFFEKNGLILDQYYLGAFCSFSLYVTNATSKMFLANCAYPWKTSSWKEAYAMKL